MFAFHIIAKPIGPRCNLQCTYCFYLEKEKLYPPNTRWIMSDEVLESFIRQHLAANDTPVVNFTWQGGEPTLLGIDFFRKAIQFQQRYANGKHIENALQTNGVLLTDEWCEFLAHHKFLVGLSLDGPETLHDQYRLNRAGRGSFQAVMQGLELLKKHGVDFNLLTVVNATNSRQPLAVYRFLKQIGSGYIQFIPIVERKSQQPSSLASPDDVGSSVTDWSVDPLRFGQFLIDIFDEWVRNDVGRQYIQLFEVALQSWLGIQQGLCLFVETCGKALALEHNGDLYSCDHFVYPKNRLGNILQQPLAELVLSEQQIKFGQDKRDLLPKYCQDCTVRFACHGECPKNRFTTTPDGEPGLNYLCPGYKQFLNHIKPYMQFMADELRQRRPPANVMHWARERDKGFPDRNPGRNDPCPCGSGKKFKKCCGKQQMNCK